MAQIIGIAGQLQQGKDTVADYLKERLHWQRAAFATKVKTTFAHAFNVDLDFIEKWKCCPTPPPGFNQTVRYGLAHIGNSFRNIKPSIWIDFVLTDSMQNTIISDVRYFNELSRIQNAGGLNVLLWRPGYENDFANDSEQELQPLIQHMMKQPDGPVQNLPFDFWLVNDGNLSALYEKIDDILIPFVKEHFQINEL